jgi:hypothetical protein
LRVPISGEGALPKQDFERYPSRFDVFSIRYVYGEVFMFEGPFKSSLARYRLFELIVAARTATPLRMLRPRLVRPLSNAKNVSRFETRNVQTSL